MHFMLVNVRFYYFYLRNVQLRKMWKPYIMTRIILSWMFLMQHFKERIVQRTLIECPIERKVFKYQYIRCITKNFRFQPTLKKE